MKGPLACLIAAVLCLGCQAPPGAIDPFIGRQTVPPPGTGTPAAIPPRDRYYNAAPKTSATTNVSPSGTPLTPPGGIEFQGKGTNVANRSGATITNGTGSTATVRRARAVLQAQLPLRATRILREPMPAVYRF